MLSITHTERVCIRAPNWVGDVVMATPAFRAIRQGLPEAHVTVIVHERVAPVLKCAPWFDETVVYAANRRLPVGKFLRCALALRSGDYRLGVLLPNSFSSALMFWLGRVKRRVGYARDMRSLLLTDAVPRPHAAGRFKPTYMVDYYLALCEHVGIKAHSRRTELHYTPSDEASVEQILREQGIVGGRPLVLVHPGAGFGPSKRWPTERFVLLSERLVNELSVQVAVIGGSQERPVAGAIVAASRNLVRNLTACGIDLHLLKCLVARSALLVTTDSGPRHYGVAFGIPTVCLMGPTDPGYSTSGLPHDIVLRVDVPCGPCQKKKCQRSHECMRGISVDMVFAACVQALSNTSRANKRDTD